MSTSLPDLLANRFEVHELIGQGGMGIVYRGIDRLTGRAVAIKTLRADAAEWQPTAFEVLTAKEEVMPANEVSISNTLHALAGVLRDQRRFRDAEPMYRRALAMREKTAPTNPRPAQETLRDFAELMRQSGRTAEADRLTARSEALQPAKK